MEIIDRIEASAVEEVRSSLVFETWRKLVGVLTDSEAATINWVVFSLRGILDTSRISSFTLPRAGTIHMVYKKFYKEAYQLGGKSVFDSTNSSLILFSGKSNTEVLAKSRLAANRLTTRIEEDLKWEWERYLTRVADHSMLIYRTKHVFAKFGGWEPPRGPNS